MKMYSYNILNRFFSKGALNELIENGTNNCYCEIVKRYSINVDGTNSEIISSIYKILRKNYKNEYYYKNTLLNNLIIKKHKIESTKVLLELPVGKSIADFVMLNGKAVVYEIKTELDNLDRIDTQINEYYKCFPYVCIITSPVHLSKILDLFAKSNVGIYTLSKRNAIKVVKEPIADYSKLSYITLFKLLRKYEYEEVLLNFDFALPKTSQFDYYSTCFSLFCKIDIYQLSAKILGILKKRCVVNSEQLTDVPEELKLLVYQTRYSDNQYDKLHQFLNSQYINGGTKDVFSLFEG